MTPDKANTLVDMHNTISTSQLEEILRMQLETLAASPELAKKLPPLMVWGAPGVGKSSVIQGIAKEYGIGFIDVRLAQREPVDVRGLPVPDMEAGKVDWLVSGEWPRDKDSRGIILFDELTAADRTLQVAAYEFILDRRLGDMYSVPDGWYIVAAGNRVVDSAVATSMSSALANRFMHVEVAEDADAWSQWAQAHDIHPSVTGFIRYKPTFLFNQANENLERGWPTPRAWERVSIMLGIVPAEKSELLRKLVYGLVGNRVGLEFMEFHTLNKDFADVREMMMNPDAEIVIPKKVDRKYALCSAMCYYLWRGKDEQEAQALMDGFFRISLKLTSDFACMALMDVASGNGRVSKKEVSAKLFYHPKWKEWEKTHGMALKKTFQYK